MLRGCLVLVVLLCLSPATVFAEGGAPQVQKVEASKKAQGLVERAATLIKEKGQEKAFVEINDVKGNLVDGE